MLIFQQLVYKQFKDTRKKLENKQDGWLKHRE